jgi:hypothetical protein
VAPALALIRGGTILHLQTLAVVTALVVLQGEPAEVLNCALDVDIVIAAVGSCSHVTGGTDHLCAVLAGFRSSCSHDLGGTCGCSRCSRSLRNTGGTDRTDCKLS